jgi:hypothetical protein
VQQILLSAHFCQTIKRICNWNLSKHNVYKNKHQARSRIYTARALIQRQTSRSVGVHIIVGEEMPQPPMLYMNVCVYSKCAATDKSANISFSLAEAHLVRTWHYKYTRACEMCGTKAYLRDVQHRFVRRQIIQSRSAVFLEKVII